MDKHFLLLEGEGGDAKQDITIDGRHEERAHNNHDNVRM